MNKNNGRNKQHIVITLGVLSVISLTTIHKFNLNYKNNTSKDSLTSNEQSATQLTELKPTASANKYSNSNDKISEERLLNRKESTKNSERLVSLLQNEKQLAKDLNPKQLKEEIFTLEKNLYEENASEKLNLQTTDASSRQLLEDKIIKLTALKIVDIENKTKEVERKFAQLAKAK